MLSGVKRVHSLMYKGLVQRKIDRAARQAKLSNEPISFYTMKENEDAYAYAYTRDNVVKNGYHHGVCISRSLVSELSKAELAFLVGHEAAHIIHYDTFSLSNLVKNIESGVSRKVILRAFIKESISSLFGGASNIVRYPRVSLPHLIFFFLRRKQEMRADMRAAQTSLEMCEGGARLLSRFLVGWGKPSKVDILFHTHPHLRFRVNALYGLQKDLTGDKSHAVFRRLACKDY